MVKNDLSICQKAARASCPDKDRAPRVAMGPAGLCPHQPGTVRRAQKRSAPRDGDQGKPRAMWLLSMTNVRAGLRSSWEVKSLGQGQ